LSLPTSIATSIVDRFSRHFKLHHTFLLQSLIDFQSISKHFRLHHTFTSFIRYLHHSLDMLYSTTLAFFALSAASVQALALPAAVAATGNDITITATGTASIAAKPDGCATSKAMNTLSLHLS
jgi:hypothetical protein